MGLLIKNGDIITDRCRFIGDMLIEGEVIARIQPHIKARVDDQVVDADGLLVIPGGVDPHTHFDLPLMGTVTKDDFQSGTIAAAAGGTTTIIDFAVPEKGQALDDALRIRQDKAKGRSAIDFALHMSVVDWNEDVARQMEIATRKGISSFKIFLAYKDTVGIDDAQMVAVMARAKELGALVMVHAENAEIIGHLQRRFLAQGKTDPIYHARSRPPLVEGEGVHRATTMARIHDLELYIVHLSSSDGLQQVRDAAFSGANVWAETCPQYLLLDETYYRRPNWEGAKWVMSPPLRTRDHGRALWAGIRGGLIATIGTDHCSFDFRGQKDMFGKDDFTKIPNGIPGVQDRLSLIYTYGVVKQRIDVHRWVALCCTNPARAFGLYPKKGTIEVGSDADLVLWDAQWTGTLSAKTQMHANDYHPYEGFAVQGKPHLVTSRGRIIWRDDRFLGTPGHGRFVKRPTTCPP